MQPIISLEIFYMIKLIVILFLAKIKFYIAARSWL